MRNRTRGALPMPITVRVPYGGGIGGVEHHSDSSEAYYMATPGLHVVTPATVADAYGLLRRSIASDDPVIFLEPKRLYWGKADWSPEQPEAVPEIGRALVRRRGSRPRSSPTARPCPSAWRRPRPRPGTRAGTGGHRSALAGAPGRGDRGGVRTAHGPGRRRPRVDGLRGSGRRAGRPRQRAVLPLPGGARTARLRLRHPLSAAHAGAASSPDVDRVLDAVARLQWESGWRSDQGAEGGVR